MPPVAPVMTATLPERFMKISPGRRGWSAFADHDGLRPSEHWTAVGGPSVDGDDRARGIRRLVRCEEGNHPADLLRSAGASKRQGLHQFFPPVCIVQPILGALLHD